MKVLLGQLNSNGDCLYATILARQIKHDYQNCELTWAIARNCRHILIGNPHVDKIWELAVDNLSERENGWYAFQEALLRIQTGPNPFDRVYLSQIWPSNFRNYDGTIRPSMLRAYDRPISVPIDSVINLKDTEYERVEKFVQSHEIDRYSHRILFECSSTSGQSYVTPAFALRIAQQVNNRLPDCCFIFSTHEQMDTPSRNIISARELGMRENAALTHHCSLFVGCGSGLSVVATSTSAKELPTIQLLSSHTSMYASFFHDFEYFQKPTDRFIEMGDESAEIVADAIVKCRLDGLFAARALYHNPLPLSFDFYLELINRWLVQRGYYFDTLESLTVTSDRYGWDESRIEFGKNSVLPYMHLDKMNCEPQSKARAESLADIICSL